MPKRLPDDLGRILADHERRLDALSSGNRLDHASLDGSTLYIKDDDGGLRDRLGKQPDGSFGNVVVRVETPPQATAPILTVGDQAGTCQVKWDGGTFDGRRVPLVHGHTEIWAELVGDDWVPTVAPGEASVRVGTIRDRAGGEVTVAMPQAGVWAVWLRIMGADRETAGPWSPAETAEILPLFDTEELEQRLEESEQRIQDAEEQWAEDKEAFEEAISEAGTRIDNLGDALSTGLDQVFADAEARAQELAEQAESNAVVQAAQDAQSEYDAIRDRQDATDDEVAAAKQAAQDAHSEAGNAMQYAATIMERVDGIQGIQSLDPPSGEGYEDGQLWEQFDSMGADRKLLGAWRWDADSGVWASIEVSTEYLPMVDISQAVITDLRAQRAFAEYAEFENLVVTARSGNLWEDPYAYEWAPDRRDETPYWHEYSPGWIAIANQGSTPYMIRSSADLDEDAVLEYRPTGHENGLPVTPGERYDLSLFGWRSSVGMTKVRAAYYDHDGNHFGYSDEHELPAGWTSADGHSVTFQVPEPSTSSNRAVARMTFQFIREVGSGNCHYGRFDLQRVAPARVIIDGLLQAAEAELERLFFDEATGRVIRAMFAQFSELDVDERAFIAGVLIRDGQIDLRHLNVTESMAVELLEAMRIYADAVTANDVHAMTFRGNRFIGGEIMTSEDWMQAGGAVVRQSGDDGNIVTVNDDGEVTSRLGGERNELAHVAVQDIDIAGELRVGSGANAGGFRPDGDRLRILGRMPHADAGARDTFTYELSGSISGTLDASTGRETWDVWYEEPAPVGGRGAIMGMHFNSLPNGISMSLGTAPTGGETASRLSARMTYVGRAGLNYAIQIRYLALWR